MLRYHRARTRGKVRFITIYDNPFILQPSRLMAVSKRTGEIVYNRVESFSNVSTRASEANQSRAK
jgi:hypothetical protein